MSTPAATVTDDQWHRIARQRVQLRPELIVTPQRFRGRRWYVLTHPLNSQYLRIDAAAYAFLGRLDGQRSIARALQDTAASGLPVVPPQGVVALLSQLQHLGCLAGGLDRSVSQLLASEDQAQRRRGLQRWLSPLAIRVPLLDPDRWLDVACRRMGRFPGRRLLTLSLVCIVVVLLLALGRWQDIAAELETHVVKPQSLLMLWCLYPLMKILHECAHALTVKRHGGVVHEMGITWLVLVPLPYVDASSSWQSRALSHRLMVSAAGMWVEMLAASIAFVVWMLTQPGPLHDAALGVFLIGFVSTVLFNANPLLKFDAYYLLQDWLEMPNLAARSAAFYRYLARRYLFAVPDCRSPQTSDRERSWLLSYGALSWCYRLFITLVIAAFLIEHYGLPGWMLALWALAQSFLWPLWRLAVWLSQSAELEGRRSRAVSACLGMSLLLVLATTAVPLSSHTTAEGVVWMPQQGQLFAPSAGVVSEVHVAPGTAVTTGTPLISLHSPELVRDLAVAEARLAGLEVLARGPGLDVPANRARHRRERELLHDEIAEYRQRLDDLQIRARMDGVFTSDHHATLLGRYFRAGELTGLIVDPSRRLVRVVVPEMASGQLLSGIRGVEVRLADALGRVQSAQLLRQTPQANTQLPSALLGAAAGGRLAVRSDDPQGRRTDKPVIHLEVSLPASGAASGVGQRAYVNLQHAPESLGRRWARTLRQVLLDKLPA